MPLYEIVVKREVAVEEATMVVRANSPSEARAKAAKEIKKNEAQWFDTSNTASLDVGGAERIDFIPDCTIIE